MNLFNVYPLMPIEPVKGQGCYVYDQSGTEYLDFYGGHAVISIGHAHPHYVKKISEQVSQLGFYSNSVINSLQQELADKLGEISNCNDYQLFLCNSGAEANENALKLASFHTGRKKILAMKRGFHGRTSGAVAITDNPKIIAPYNANHQVTRIELNDIDAMQKELASKEYAAIIIEGIQGIAGIYEASDTFLQAVEKTCQETGTLFVSDSIQCGYARSGDFFSHQKSNVKPDIISMAKGMGNGFPIGGILISPKIEAHYGMLGTTFGGNHLACAAAIAVLDVIKEENILENVQTIGTYFKTQLEKIEGIKEVRGRGLMLAVELEKPIKELRSTLVNEAHIFTGSAGDPHVLRLLPPLNIKKEHVDLFLKHFVQYIEDYI
ncbi:acetylornithine transaminase [Flavobacteriaceae bacterium UJ101]|nr:acetylornithine transaminase [Flavobacteriaceae bacterium UJ101]